MPIIEYKEVYKPYFKSLNIAWIAKHFTVEAHDLKQLDYPKDIVAAGGMIFFATETSTKGLSDAVVGTAALVKLGSDFELVKMAVEDSLQGRGTGKLLLDFSISYAKSHGGAKIWLESNRKLSSAIHLYQQAGFKEVPIKGSHYDRADIAMELKLH